MANNDPVESLFGKRHVLIAVLDSGLGGLSVCAEMERMLNAHPLFRAVTLSYFNVWPEPGRGYNALETVAERVLVFDRALNAVNAHGPDLVMIACNTLSVLYERTPFSRAAAIPVVNIIGFGVDMIRDSLSRVPGSRALILGTRTTVAERTHTERLSQMGIDPARIAAQHCHGVATEIEKGPHSVRVKQLVDGYMDEAVRKLTGASMVVAALCCTHFGYSRDIFRHALERRLPVDVQILNPNRAMGRFLLQANHPLEYDATAVTVAMQSKIKLLPASVRKIGAIIQPQAPRTAEALQGYVYAPDLF